MPHEKWQFYHILYITVNGRDISGRRHEIRWWWMREAGGKQSRDNSETAQSEMELVGTGSFTFTAQRSACRE